MLAVYYTIATIIVGEEIDKSNDVNFLCLANHEPA